MKHKPRLQHMQRCTDCNALLHLVLPDAHGKQGIRIACWPLPRQSP